MSKINTLSGTIKKSEVNTMRKTVLGLFCCCCVAWSVGSTQYWLQFPNKQNRSMISSVKRKIEQKLEQEIDFIYDLASLKMKDVGHFLEVYSSNIRDLSIGFSCLFLAVHLGGVLYEGQKLLSQINFLLEPSGESLTLEQGAVGEIIARVQMAVRQPSFLLRCLGFKKQRR